MKLEEIIEAYNSPEYDFLRKEPRLNDRLIFITLGGSHAYGTNVEGSDLDIRGCALEQPSDIVGFTNFEEYCDKATDTTVYGFNKLVKLLIDCNPNTIELLGCKPEHYLYMTDIGRQMIDNRHLFLSKKAFSSFCRYATQQLRRLENALAHDHMPQAQTEEHILSSMKRAMKSFSDRYDINKFGSFLLRTDISQKEELDTEVVADITLTGFPVRNFNVMINELGAIASQYEKLTGRNKKKDEQHLNKHAMHLIRLYLMCLDILERGEIVTYREKGRDFLLDIRAGKYMKEDGTYVPEFFDMITEYEQKIKYARDNSPLPNKPDMAKIQELVMDVNRKTVDGKLPVCMK